MLTLKIDSSDIVLLNESAVQIYPVLGAVTSLTNGTVSGSGTGNALVLIENSKLSWFPADTSIGRNQDGWWTGIKVTAPAHAAIGNIQFRRKTATGWTEPMAFAPDNGTWDTMQLWGLVTAEYLDQFIAQNRNMNYTWQFDWDNNGTFEQTVTMTVVPTGVTLEQAGFGFAIDSDTITYGDNNNVYAIVAPTGGQASTITYSVSDSSVAVVDGNTLIIKKAGTVTITATLSGNHYEDISASYTLTIDKAQQTGFAFAEEEDTITYNDTDAISGEQNKYTLNAIGGQSTGDVVYEIVSGDAATLAPGSNVLTIQKSGTVTVEATKLSDDCYLEAKATFTLTIEKDEQTLAFTIKTDEITYNDVDKNVAAGTGEQNKYTLLFTDGNTAEATTFAITSGDDVATLTGNLLTILKSGTVTIKVSKAGDDCYLDAEDTFTLTVKKDEQTGFGFADDEVTITYNDKDAISSERNKYTLVAVGGQSTADVIYTPVSGDAATLNGNVLTIVKSGTITIKATRPADDRYEAIESSITLTVEKADQSFTFNHGKEVNVKYGLTSFATQITRCELNSGLISYSIPSNNIGASIANDGVVSIQDSSNKVGTITVTVTLMEDDCYNKFVDTYTFSISYENAPAKPYELLGDKIIAGGDWFTSDKVTIKAPVGYQISYSNKLAGNTWDTQVEWDSEGYWSAWGNNAPVVYLKSADGGITDAINVEDLKLDKSLPKGLSITYTANVWATIGEKLFAFNDYDVEVTLSAADAISGIAKMEYSLNDGAADSYVEVQPNNDGEYKFTVAAPYRGQLWLKATDVAGNEQVIKHLDGDTDKVLIIDNTAPGITVGYTGTMNDASTDEIRYVKGEKVTIIIEVSDEHYDLRAANPVVTENGAEKDGWTVNAQGNGELRFVLDAEGNYDLAAKFTDRLNRTVNYAAQVRIDRTIPTIKSDVVKGMYYTEDQVFTLTITDHNFDSSKVVLAVDAVGSKNNALLSQTEKNEFAELAKDISNWDHIDGTDVYELKLPITKDGNYTVSVDVTDKLEWAAETYKTNFTVDKVDPSQPTITYEVETNKTILGKLFGFDNETVVVTVQSSDAVSGIDRLEYKLHDEDAFTVVNMDTDGKFSFNLDPQYRGEITTVVYDKAGRHSETVDEREIVIDNIAPQVEIEFAGDRQDTVKVDTNATVTEFDSDTRFIYNNNVTATITVDEANFFPENEDMSITVKCDGAVLEDLAAAGISDSGWVLANGIYTRTFVLTKDGDYQILAEYKDHSLNDMDWESNEYEKNGSYSYASNIHTIDTTAPVYEITYDNNAVVQTLGDRDYFAAGRTATIKVTDRNFRPDEVVFTVVATDMAGANAEYTYSKLTAWSDWKTEDNLTWVATVPFAVDANYVVQFDYRDMATNSIANPYETRFTVDTTIPDQLKVSYNSKDETVINKVLNAITFGNYTAKQEVVLSMNDLTAGIDYIKLTVTPIGATSATNLTMPMDLEVYADGTVKSGTKGFISSFSATKKDGDLAISFDIPAQFRGKVTYVAYDKSGNSANSDENPGVFVVDTIAPEYTVTYNPSNVVNVSDMKDMNDYDAADGILDTTNKKNTYVMYFSGDAVATLKIAEANFDSSYVNVQVLDADGKAVDGWKLSSWTTATEEGKADVHTATITIADEGDYQLKVFYQDHSMNKAVDYLSNWIVIDKTAPVIDVTYTNKDVKNTIDDRQYFDAAQTATITVTEHNFRADDVVIKVSAKDLLGTDLLTLNRDGTVKKYAEQGTDRSAWSAFEAGSWRREDDTYVIVLNYALDANYTFDIEYQDLAKNKATDYAEDLFTVDTTAPQNLTVDYSTSFFSDLLESITFGYYNAQLTVTITAQDSTSGILHFAYSYINSEGVSSINKELLDQAIKAAEITYDGKKATATFTVPKMVLGDDNQFNGTVKFTAFDRAENNTELADNTRIIVDNISPVADITYNAPVQTANGISYYAGDINATLVITEANFDSNDVTVLVNDAPVAVTWTDESVDVHTGTFKLTKDGDYVVSVEYKDKSGNQMNSYTSNKLVLDATKPSIKVSDIKANSANKDEKYGFEILLNDTNLDDSTMKPILKAVVKNAEGKYETVEIDLGEPDVVEPGKTYEYTVDNLPEDALYTLTCEVKDMAKNGMAQIVLEDGNSYDQVLFSINRNGSTFGYGNTFTEELINQYYVYSVDKDVVVVEVNVDPIQEYKVSLNGKELTEGTDYTTTQTSNDGEWSIRSYIIKKENFTNEGEYNIIVSSVDKAETTAFSDIKELSIAFVVDQTKPVITIAGMESGGRYQTEAQTVTLIPTDEGGRLNSLMIVVMDSSGNPLKDENGMDISVLFNKSGKELLDYLEQNDGMVVFTIPEGLNNQIKIFCDDCAVGAEEKTNEYVEVFEKITVSPNQLVIFYANTGLFIGTIAGALAIIALIIILLKRKNNKKSDNKTKATV